MFIRTDPDVKAFYESLTGGKAAAVAVDADEEAELPVVSGDAPLNADLFAEVEDDDRY
jgi:hypothetical protein